MKASSRRTSRKKVFARVVLLVASALALLFFVPRVIGIASSVVFAPVAYFETWFYESGNTLPSYLRDRKVLLDEIQSLKKEVMIERSALNTISRLQAENTELRHMLGEESVERIAAAVIGRPGATPYDVLVIDRGSNDGVLENAPVYVGIDTAIGYVAKVFPDTSIVTLVTTPSFESTVYIIGPNIYTNARGIGGGVLEVSVPQGILLEVGDLVVVPSFDSGVYGTIDVVNSIPSEPEQRGYVTLKVPMHTVRFVSIGTSPLSPRTFDEAVAVVEEVKKDLAKVPVPSGVLVDISTATGTATSTPLVENASSAVQTGTE